MTDLSRELEILPLSEREWSRIEGGVFARLDREPVAGESPVMVAAPRRTPWRLSFAVAAVAAVAGLLAFVLLRGDASHRATEQRSRIVTNQSSSHVDLAGATLEIAPESALVVSGNEESGLTVILERGAVRCTVEPRGERPPFAVQSGKVRVEVVGTIFSVLRDGDETRVAVKRGVVRVIASDQLTLVHAGERWPARADHERDELDGSEVAAEDDDQMVVIDDGDEFVRQPRRPHAPSRATSGAETAPVATTQPSDKQRYKAAERLEATDPRAAIRGYREVAEGSGLWAANALFAQARLEYELGNTDAAARLLRSYLDHYPTGANRSDAERLLQGLPRK